MAMIQAVTTDQIQVKMFGGFSLSSEGITIDDRGSRQRQLWNLLEYLIASRRKTVSQEELISVLWPDDSAENPSSALKNLVYRARNLLKEKGFSFAKESIVMIGGTYAWNKNLDCVVDVEEFEQLIQKAGDQTLPEEERIALYLESLKLYEGDFLPSSGYEEWVISLNSYYRSMYFKCVYDAIDLLMKKERFDEIRSICERAIIIDPFEERAHKYLIYSLIKQDKQAAALEHYNRVTDLFYRELGVKPSESMRNLYREIVKAVNSVETDLGVIKEDLSEHSMIDGAFYCDYEVFRNMYRMEARTAVCSGQSIFIALFTVTDHTNQVPETKILGKVMDVLLQSVQKSLRKGDVVSRFSSTQYVLMLPTLTFENGQMVLSRILKKFSAAYHGKDIKVHTTLQPLDPIG
ncbi:winged helix-turn-helix domain-containing protein [Oscillospiraceae bacterium NSJ-64]|uniref:Winged helix-turn-helix domain-containing protein n=2 Tax=Youxingia wuxianensis TaxID=2763678 RepID=A0A926ENY5_9FIRM|nr:winged helix-turn-helix domain-containing protein [Youxingia wuxianensis]